MINRPPPLIFPPELNPIAYIIGYSRAMRLAYLSEGAPVWIPRLHWLDHEQLVVDVIGMEMAHELCGEMGGQYWQPPDFREAARPLCEGRKVQDWAEIQFSVPEIAARLEIKESRVHALLTALAMWYQTGDLDLASRHIGEPPYYLSLMLNEKY